MCLYNNALRDYNAARYDLALSQFQDYLKYYPTTDLAGNAQFYIADMEYRSGNFEAAVADYDKVIEQFPGGNKAAAAQLKKGYSLLELGRKDAGVRELNALIQRYPRTIEATQARERLKKLGASERARPQLTPRNNAPPDPVGGSRAANAVRTLGGKVSGSGKRIGSMLPLQQLNNFRAPARRTISILPTVTGKENRRGPALPLSSARRPASQSRAGANVQKIHRGQSRHLRLQFQIRYPV